jgi:hypothetical protein
LRRIADSVVYAADGEELVGIVPAEPASGFRLYVCAYGQAEESTWLVLDATGVPVEERASCATPFRSRRLRGRGGGGGDRARGAQGRELRVPRRARREWGGAAASQRLETVEELLRDVERGYKRPLS